MNKTLTVYYNNELSHSSYFKVKLEKESFKMPMHLTSFNFNTGPYCLIRNCFFSKFNNKKLSYRYSKLNEHDSINEIKPLTTR